jgi:thiamine monophosphate kinase
MQLLRQTKTLMGVTVLAANFSDAEAIGAVPVYLATTKKT